MTTDTSKRKATPRKAGTRKAPGAPAAKTLSGTSGTPGAGSTPAPTVVKVTGPVVAQADLKKKELIDLVVERSGIKKKDAKPVIEAMLAVLGETIASGRELNLQPLGKLRINRSTDKGNGRVIVCKLRQSNARPKEANPPLAEASDTL